MKKTSTKTTSEIKERSEVMEPSPSSSGLGQVVTISLRMALVTLVLTGLIYPFVMTGVSQLLFASKANGSLIRNEKGEVIGSELIGQLFTNPAYFQSRPSAAGNGYDAAASSGSNLGTSSAKLKERVAAEVARLRAENPLAPREIPSDLVTASGSGLDPHISPDGARWQVSRIAAARHLSEQRVLDLVESQIEGRTLGIFGEPRVHVLKLNLALERQFGKAVSSETR